MGKGDQKSRRGKIAIGSYGKTRPRKAAKSGTAKTATKKSASKNKA